ESQQTTNFRTFIKHNWFYPCTNQNIRTAKTRRTCTNNCDFFIGPLHIGHVWTPAQSKGGVVDIFFSIANGDRAETVVQGTSPFTETVLRTDTATDFRQGIGLVTQFSRLKQTSFSHQFQPVWNIVMYRTFPFTIGVTTT